MSKKFDLPLRDSQLPAIRFPNRCVSCGRPKETDEPLKVERNVMRGNKTRQIAFTLNVPLCHHCQARDRRVSLLTMGAFVIGGLLAAVISFLPFVVWGARLEQFLGTGSDTQTRGFVFVLAAFLALLVGISGGFVVEVVIKLLFTPIWGLALWRYPTWVAQIFADEAVVLGLTAQITREGRSLRLNFWHDDISREFAQENPS